MRYSWISLCALCFVGCATRQQSARAPVASTSPAPVLREASVTRVVETRYDVRAYRDADNPNVRHDAHAVYRETRVPARVESLDVTPRSAFAPASYSPLPVNAELSAELEAQRRLTAELRDIKARMAAIETQAQSQYGSLVSQTADALKLRQQLITERARVQELEAKLRDKAAAPAVSPASTTAAVETRW